MLVALIRVVRGNGPGGVRKLLRSEKASLYVLVNADCILSANIDESYLFRKLTSPAFFMNGSKTRMFSHSRMTRRNSKAMLFTDNRQCFLGSKLRNFFFRHITEGNVDINLSIATKIFHIVLRDIIAFSI